MTEQIRHRRLHAFYNSKVLNALAIVMVVGLSSSICYNLLTLPLICVAIALLLFIAYSLWLWIKKPAKIVIDSRLSNISSAFLYYYLIILTIKATNEWWYIVPCVCAIAVLFICLIKPKDQMFNIVE